MNPRREGKEHCKSITLRKTVENLIEADNDVENVDHAENPFKNSVVKEPKKVEVKAPKREDTPIVPFPE